MGKKLLQIAVIAFAISSVSTSAQAAGRFGDNMPGNNPEGVIEYEKTTQDLEKKHMKQRQKQMDARELGAMEPAAGGWPQGVDPKTLPGNRPHEMNKGYNDQRD